MGKYTFTADEKDNFYKEMHKRYQDIAKEDRSFGFGGIPFDELKMEAKNETFKPVSVQIAPVITKIIATDGATVVFFKRGTVTSKQVVRLGKGEKYDLDTAVAYAIAKELCGSNSAFKRIILNSIDDRRVERAPKAKVDNKTDNVSKTDGVSNADEQKESKKDITVIKKDKKVNPYAKKRGPKPATKVTVLENSPHYDVLKGHVLPIKSKDKKRTVVVMKDNELYSLKYGTYRLFHDRKDDVLKAADLAVSGRGGRR